MPVKDLQRIEDFREEHTNGEFQDRPYCGHLFYATLGYTDHIPFWMGMIISGLFFVLAFRMIFKSLFRANIEIITTEEGERLSAMHISPGQLLILIVSSVIIVSLLLLFLTP